MKKLTSILFLSLLLTACMPILSADTTLTLKSEEVWTLKSLLIMDNQSVNMFRAQIEQSLQSMVNEAQSVGIKAEWKIGRARRDGNIPVQVTLQGIGFEALNSELLNQDMLVWTEVDGNRQLRFYLDTWTGIFGEVLSSTFTLKGGKILETNGEKTSPRTVRWVNQSGEMYALTEPPGKSPDLKSLLGGATLATCLLGGFLIVRSHRAKFNCPYCGCRIRARATYCPFCGEYVGN